MKTKICIIVGLLGYLTLCVHAETRTYNNLRYTGDWTGNAIIIEDNELVYDTIFYDYANSTVPIDSFKCWSPSGDIKIIQSTPSYVVIASTYAGKSRITYEYGRDPNCGNRGYFSLDIYKHFDAYEKYGIEIEGPDCVGDSETVVFSIKPLLTRHINSGIGMDMYEWSIVYPDSIPFIDTVTYVSGDSSSITFKTGQITSDARISVRVGRANQEFLLFKKLGQNAPKPVIDVDTACFMYGEEVKTFHIQNPVEGVLYQWNTQNPNWNISPVIGTDVTIKSAGESDLDIVVTAYYEGQEACSASQSIIKVKRSWGDSITLKCISDNSLPYRFGESYTFKIAGEIAGTSYDWTLPSGWDFVPRTSTNTSEIQIFPSKQDNLKLVDTLRVAATNSCAGAEIDNEKLLVYMKPAKVTSIDNPTCLTPGDTYTFHINDWENGPKAEKYIWKVNGIEQTAYDSDSLVYTVHSSDSLITIIPQGAQFANNAYYYGETTNIRLYYNASAPSAITPDKCIASGMIDTIIFSLDGIQENQDYLWVLPNGMDSIDSDAHNTWMKVQTNGVPGDYPIQVQGIGSGTCGNSPVITDTFIIDTAHIYIYPEISQGYIVFRCVPKNSSVEVSNDTKWFVDGVHQPYDGAMLCFLLGNTYDSVSVEATVNGCKQRVTIYNTSMQQAPARKTTKDFNKLIIKPNPAQTISSITLPERIDNSNIIIYNADGKIIKEWITNEQEVQIQISELPDGIYPIVAVQNDAISSNVLIIKH